MVLFLFYHNLQR